MALPPPSLSCCQGPELDLGLGDVAGLGGAAGDVPGEADPCACLQGDSFVRCHAG